MVDMEHIKDIINPLVKDQMVRSRQYKNLIFNVQFPFWVFARAIEKLPLDTYILGAGSDIFSGVNKLLLWSSEFGYCHQGSPIPELHLEANSDTKEVSIYEIDKDGSWKYLENRKKEGPGQRVMQMNDETNNQ